MAKSYSKSKARKSGGGFIQIPHVVTDSASFQGLSGIALIILLHLLRGYRGHNNGDLSAPFSCAAKYGIASQSTWYKGLTELINTNLIIKTRDSMKRGVGNPHGLCALYAITWQPIDYCDGKLDCEPTISAPRKFSIQ
jgi:hypothetical protein